MHRTPSVHRDAARAQLHLSNAHPSEHDLARNDSLTILRCRARLTMALKRQPPDVTTPTRAPLAKLASTTWSRVPQRQCCTVFRWCRATSTSPPHWMSADLARQPGRRSTRSTPAKIQESAASDDWARGDDGEQRWVETTVRPRSAVAEASGLEAGSFRSGFVRLPPAVKTRRTRCRPTGERQLRRANCTSGSARDRWDHCLGRVG